LFYRKHFKTVPNYLLEILPNYVNQTNDYNLRNEHNYLVSSCRLGTFEKSFLPNTTNMWNMLDPTIRNIDQFNYLKDKLSKRNRLLHVIVM